MSRALRRTSAALVLLGILISWPATGAEAAGRCDGTIIDRVWTGARIQFGSVATDRYAFIVYYDSERRLTVARVDLDTCTTERKNLPSTFKGWDSHSLTAVTLDTLKRVHVAGNMHAEPLTYFRGRDPLDIASLAAAEMTGRDEARVTYPAFLNIQGELVFRYREGRSGNGYWLLNRWSNDRWTRVTGNQLFSSLGPGSKGRVSAYPTEFLQDADGVYHVAVVWRGHGRGVQQNFRVSYAQTRDFEHWMKHDGQPITLPMSPDGMETIDDVGRNNGLVNNHQLAISPNGVPYVSYAKYAPDGRNGVFVASFTESRWHIQLVGELAKPSAVEGRGTLRDVPRVAAVSFDTDPFVAVSFPGEPTRNIALSGASAPPVKRLARDRLNRYPPLAEEWRQVRDPQLRTSSPAGPIDVSRAKVPEIGFTWVTNRPNNDEARECTAVAPTDCKPPPSPLILQDDRR